MSDDDDELAALRRKKMAELVARQKGEKLQHELNSNAEAMLDQKIEYCMQVLMAPDAYAYFSNMKKTNPRLHERITALLFPPQVLFKIDALVANIRSGQVPRGDIWLVDIQKIEREMLGVKSSISVKKRGEKDRVDIASMLKGNGKPDD
jgi:DNA-binding TFAR19-related protein (PDSD5 family)